MIVRRAHDERARAGAARVLRQAQHERVWVGTPRSLSPGLLIAPALNPNSLRPSPLKPSPLSPRPLNPAPPVLSLSKHTRLRCRV